MNLIYLLILTRCSGKIDMQKCRICKILTLWAICSGLLGAYVDVCEHSLGKAQGAQALPTSGAHLNWNILFLTA